MQQDEQQVEQSVPEVPAETPAQAAPVAGKKAGKPATQSAEAKAQDPAFAALNKRLDRLDSLIADIGKQVKALSVSQIGAERNTESKLRGLAEDIEELSPLVLHIDKMLGESGKERDKAGASVLTALAKQEAAVTRALEQSETIVRMLGRVSPKTAPLIREILRELDARTRAAGKGQAQKVTAHPAAWQVFCLSLAVCVVIIGAWVWAQGGGGAWFGQ